ncbi:hypothetical protein [Bradyrhizobium sp.]|uniref:hypothetical protein n=1 Tax=Bradyrhizobium sp. TaxID=376 RepID=UPI004037903E
MTRAITIVALTCILVVGAAATSILGRDSVPAASADYAAPSAKLPVVSNKQAKADKLAVVALATAAVQPQQAIPQFPEPLRQAYAAAAPADLTVPNVTAPPAAPKPKPAAAKPPVQKNYTLLSDVQIAGIKERLKLSPDQESYWPDVEKALRAIARKMHSTKQADPAAGAPPIDPDSEEVAQLKSAAMPLLFQLREDQKREVRALARVIGLERVASMI